MYATGLEDKSDDDEVSRLGVQVLETSMARCLRLHLGTRLRVASGYRNRQVTGYCMNIALKYCQGHEFCMDSLGKYVDVDLWKKKVVSVLCLLDTVWSVSGVH